jgi:hypothetical protein
MRALIDSVFKPVLNWLQNIYDSISDLIVPISRPLNVDNYFGVFGYFGSGWQDFAETVCVLAFIYVVCYVIVTQIELLRKFKDLVKWW